MRPGMNPEGSRKTKVYLVEVVLIKGQTTLCGKNARNHEGNTKESEQKRPHEGNMATSAIRYPLETL